MKRPRALWAVFAIAVGVVAGAMSWITNDLLAFECAQREARAEAAHQEAMRLALWRMDSWVGPAIAAEAESVSPASARLVRAVYGIAADGRMRTLRGSDAASEQIARAVDVASARRRIGDVEARVAQLVCVANSVAIPADQNLKEYASRAKAQLAGQNANFGNRNSLQDAPYGAASGPLVAAWVAPDGGAPELVFVRRSLFVMLGSGFEDHGDVTVFVADWPAIQRGLLEQVSDVLPSATFRPILQPGEGIERGFVLASIPVALEAPRPRAAPITGVTPTRGTLVVAWAALAFAFVAVGISLRRTVDLADRRSRFASSVTHELRTPLTTFRLYSEMLADGMVAEPAKRQEYLYTLKSESSRLATLVENVLAYARVEEGRMPVRRERIAVGDLLLRAQPPLDRRAQEAAMTLSVTAGDAGSTIVDVDPAVVGQILFNLVDNACKYARDAAQRSIELTAAEKDGVVALRVRDHGPGLAPDRTRAAFTPFERAGRPAGDTVPGIGLGLALSRALARDLGGDLDLERADGGASFVLTLPVAGRA